MSQDALTVVRRVYEEILGRGRMEDPATVTPMRELFAPDVEVRQMDILPGTGGTFHGYDGLWAAGAEVVRFIADQWLEPRKLVAAGNRVAAVVDVRGRGRSSGAPIEITVGHVFDVEDGRVVRWAVHREPADALAALGAAD
jgi:ketosteroid isomerase-like protein